MAIEKEKISRWLDMLPDGTLVGIDEGTLCLIANTPSRDDKGNAHFSVGDRPEEPGVRQASAGS